MYYIICGKSYVLKIIRKLQNISKLTGRNNGQLQVSMQVEVPSSSMVGSDETYSSHDLDVEGLLHRQETIKQQLD